MPPAIHSSAVSAKIVRPTAKPWFHIRRKFGDDTFVAGAHFDVVDPDTRVIERWVLITLIAVLLVSTWLLFL